MGDGDIMSNDEAYIIGVVRREYQLKPLGYRILYKETIKDLKYDALYKVMKQDDCVQNAKLIGNKIIATNGSFERYGTVTSDGSVENDNYVIIKKYNLTDKNNQVIKAMYELVTTSGRVYMIKESEVIKQCEMDKVANGKLLNNENSKHIVSIDKEHRCETVLNEIFWSKIFNSNKLPIQSMDTIYADEDECIIARLIEEKRKIHLNK